MNPEAYLEMAATESNHWWFVARRKILSNIINNLNLSTHSKILEIGCGTGGNLDMLSKFGEVHAIEKNPTAREIALKKSNSHYDIQIGYCPEKIPYEYEQDKFDLICMFDVLEHIEKDQETLVSIKKLLSNNGYLVLTVPAYQWLWGAHDEYLHHKRRYTISRIQNLITSIGISTLRISYFNTLLFPLVVMVRLKEKILHSIAPAGNKIPNKYLNSGLKNIFNSEKYLLNKFNFPFGTSIVGIFQNKC